MEWFQPEVFSFSPTERGDDFDLSRFDSFSYFSRDEQPKDSERTL